MTDDERAALRLVLRDHDPAEIQAMADFMGLIAEFLKRITDEAERAALLAPPDKTKH